MNRHFISYPKSGRSWIRYACNQLGVCQAINFHHDTFEFNNGDKPRPNFDFASRLRKYQQVDRTIYLYREPRDIMVSLYFQIKGRFNDFFQYKGSLSEFIRDDYFGAKNLKIFQDQWDRICQLGIAKCITYEQCHENFSDVLRRVLEYYEISASENDILVASRLSSFDAMKRVEESGKFQQPWLRLRNGFPKVREGKMNSYKEYFSKNDLEYLQTIFH